MLRLRVNGIRWVTASSIALIILALILLVPVKQEPYIAYEQRPIISYVEVQEPYSALEYYVEQEPYTVTEKVWVQKPSTITVPVTYRVVEADSATYIFDPLVPGFKAWIYIQNTDTVNARFSVTFDLVLFGGGRLKESTVVYVFAGSKAKAGVTYKGQYLSSFSFDVTPSTKTIDGYISALGEQEVTKYKEVQRSRQVTKYKTVYRQEIGWETHQVIRYRRISLVGIKW